MPTAAARKPGDAITREATGLAEFEKAVKDYPALVQAAADAALVLARSALRTQNRAVERMNKRACRKRAAEALRARADSNCSGPR